MKRILLFLALFTLLAAIQTSLFAQTIYVKSSASGANNGTSWADAFTTLDAALVAAVAGNQVWVAAGTYKPTLGIVPNSSFMLLAGVELYGGFTGTETTLNARNYLTNVTTLSGDVNGNDVSTDLTMNRSDNSWHVLVVSNGSPALRAIVDGLVIRNGNTKTATADPDATKRGGGIFANAKVTVRNCLFTENQGFIGGSIAALNAAGSGLIVDNCIFDNNRSTNASAGIQLQGSTGASINRCIFRNNNTNRGTLYIDQGKDVVIDSCVFENNLASEPDPSLPGRWGAGLYNWQSSYTITNSVFQGNTAYNGAGMYNDGRQGGDSFVVDNCVFEANAAANYGGAGMFNFNANFTIKNCTFLANTAPTSATALYIGGETSPGGRVQNCTFENGSTNFGGSAANYSSPAPVIFEDCTFNNNTAATSGGALTSGFKANSVIKRCHFEANTARFGGAIFAQNDLTTVLVDSSSFVGNGGTDIGGAVYLSAGNTSRFTHTTFTLNSSNNGGALVISEDSLDLSTSVIDRCIFQENFGLNQAGALNIENADVRMTNTLFAGNQVLGTGAGGAVLLNGFNGKTARLTAINSTWGGNSGPLGTSLAQFEGDSGKAEVTLQNCIFSNDGGDNYAIEAGAPIVNSLGGNLTNEASLATFLTGPNDLTNTDPLFVEPGFFDFHLSPGSPAIDHGIADGAPLVDLEGNPRVGPPDAGSYEWGTTKTQEVLTFLPLSLQPNPAVDVVRAIVENNWRGSVLLDVVDGVGRVVRHLSFRKTDEKMPLEFSVTDLPQGSYLVRVQMGALRMSGGLVKR